MGRPRKNPLTIKKICEHCNKEFEISYNKKNQRFCNKHCSNSCNTTKDKIRKSQNITFDKKYGGHPMTTDNVKKNFQSAMESKYGVKHALQNSNILKTMKSTKIERYGDENYNNEEKRKQTCLQRYDVDNIRKCEWYKPILADHRRNNHYEYLLNYFKEGKLTLLTTPQDYNGIWSGDKYEFCCDDCNNRFVRPLYSIASIECDVCNPSPRYKEENSLHTFLLETCNDLIIERRNRIILKGQELDFLIHKKRLAIEYNGLYWHSESRGKNKIYHLNKTVRSLTMGYNLIHIFDYEWNTKQEIVKSIIRSKIGEKVELLYARNFKVKQVESNISNSFLINNHIQGKDNAPIRYGLFNKHDELMSLMTFRKSRFDKSVEYELSRFCNILNVSITGGASKLYSHFVKNHNPNSVISYSDRRYFDGNLYNVLGFDFINNTAPGFHFVSPDYKTLYNWQQFQKHMLKDKLTGFDPNLTAWENMKNHGFDRIWDCGNSKWIWKST